MIDIIHVGIAICYVIKRHTISGLDSHQFIIHSGCCQCCDVLSVSGIIED